MNASMGVRIWRCAMACAVVFLATVASASMITAMKETSPVVPNKYHVGDTISYLITVGNPAVNLQDNRLVLIEDTRPDGSKVKLNGADVIQAPGESITYRQVYVVAAADVQTVNGKKVVVNQVAVKGVDSSEDWVGAIAEKRSTIIFPAINIVKTASPTMTHAGDLVTYTYTVKNVGDVPLRSVTVVDNIAGVTPVYSSGDANADGVLDLTETWIFTATAKPTATVTNTGTAEGTDELNKKVTDTDTATVTVIHPGINVIKEGVMQQLDFRTYLVTYNYVVNNTGDVPLRDVTLVDDRLGTIPGPSDGDSNHDGLLDLTETWFYMASTQYVSSGQERKECNTAVATGTDVLGKQVSDSTNICMTIPGLPPPGPCDLGYPFVSSNPRTSVIFNEAEVLRAFETNVMGAGRTVKMWYNDEHALSLGVRQVVVKTASGTQTINFPFSPLTGNPGSVVFPSVGTTALTGDTACTDPMGRPIFPALFITDITFDPDSHSGDWQYGGTAIAPHAVFGTWKGCVRKVDKTRTPALVTMVPDADPAKNSWNLDGGDPAPAGLVNQGFGAEIRWNVDSLGLQDGHVYRLQFMVHDGDQNKSGGDVGEACIHIRYVAPAIGPAWSGDAGATQPTVLR